MPELAVVTPSYAPDFDAFSALHRSVLEYTPDDTVHHVLVPPQDKELFGRFAGPRCKVWTGRDLLPARYRHVPNTGMWVNVKRPLQIPVRGWVMQQAFKVLAVARAESDAVLICDSDVVLLRPVHLKNLLVDGRVPIHRVKDGVHAGMTRHLIWYKVAAELLGMPPIGPPPYDDHVCPCQLWDPRLVRDMQAKVQEVTGKHWLDAFTSHVHVGEFPLYGTYCDNFVQPRPVANNTLCHMYWEDNPFDLDGALAFADQLPAEAIGMLISAKSNTPFDVRQAAIQRCKEIVSRDR